MHRPFSELPDIARDPALHIMFEARKRVFVDLLGWDVPVVQDTLEVDQFDDRFATYIVLTGHDGAHRASARLLQTVRPHILGSLFPGLCEDAVPARQDIREITRFCIEPTLNRRERRRARNELVSALADHALSRGIAAYTAVAGESWFRQISDFGWRCSPLGEARRIGSEQLVALRIDIDATTVTHLTESGIYVRRPYRAIEIEWGLAA